MKLRWEESTNSLGYVWHLLDEEDNVIAHIEAGWPLDKPLAEVADTPYQYRGKFLGKWTKWNKRLKRACSETEMLVVVRSGHLRNSITDRLCEGSRGLKEPTQ